MERRQIRFHGRVQGVGFRATARAVAGEFAVSGWVRNEPDGTVLMEVQGAASEVEACLTALRREMGANIRREDTARADVVEGDAGFRITR
jgi:acylphosphatase